jgi:uncharacterized protein YjbJ (UPF0337 family)
VREPGATGSIAGKGLHSVNRIEDLGTSQVIQREERMLMSATDKAKNKLQETKGRVKEATGKATDDRSLEEKGKGDRASGNLKQAGEKVKDAFRK